MRPAYGAEESVQSVTIVVDVANVMGSRPDGWWRDRAGAAVRLHAELTALAARGPAALAAINTALEPGETTAEPEFVMVLEGAARAAAPRIDASPGPVRVVRAGGSGDDAIVALVRELPGRRIVVTADRELRRRCEAAGATVLGPRWLLDLLHSPLTRDQQ
jgi:8-oxo-dGTP diphosphatase